LAVFPEAEGCNGRWQVEKYTLCRITVRLNFIVMIHFVNTLDFSFACLGDHGFLIFYPITNFNTLTCLDASVVTQ